MTPGDGFPNTHGCGWERPAGFWAEIPLGRGCDLRLAGFVSDSPDTCLQLPPASSVIVFQSVGAKPAGLPFPQSQSERRNQVKGVG